MGSGNRHGLSGGFEKFIPGKWGYQKKKKKNPSPFVLATYFEMKAFFICLRSRTKRKKEGKKKGCTDSTARKIFRICRINNTANKRKTVNELYHLKQ